MTLTFDAHPRSSLIVALDFDSLSSALNSQSRLPISWACSRSATSSLPPRVLLPFKEVAALGAGIFLDLKFHDIPNTVAGAVLSSAAMTGAAVNVHALGGSHA